MEFITNPNGHLQPLSTYKYQVEALKGQVMKDGTVYNYRRHRKYLPYSVRERHGLIDDIIAAIYAQRTIKAYHDADCALVQACKELVTCVTEDLCAILQRQPDTLYNVMKENFSVSIYSSNVKDIRHILARMLDYHTRRTYVCLKYGYPLGIMCDLKLKDIRLHTDEVDHCRNQVKYLMLDTIKDAIPPMQFEEVNRGDFKPIFDMSDSIPYSELYGFMQHTPGIFGNMNYSNLPDDIMHHIAKRVDDKNQFAIREYSHSTALRTRLMLTMGFNGTYVGEKLEELFYSRTDCPYTPYEIAACLHIDDVNCYEDIECLMEHPYYNTIYLTLYGKCTAPTTKLEWPIVSYNVECAEEHEHTLDAHTAYKLFRNYVAVNKLNIAVSENQFAGMVQACDPPCPTLRKMIEILSNNKGEPHTVKEHTPTDWVDAYRGRGKDMIRERLLNTDLSEYQTTAIESVAPSYFSHCEATGNYPSSFDNFIRNVAAELGMSINI